MMLKFVPKSPPSPGPERRVADTVIERPEIDDIVRQLVAAAGGDPRSIICHVTRAGDIIAV